MRPFLAALLAGLAVAGAAQARDPRLERLALRPVDMDLARGAVARKADLGGGWTAVPTSARDDSPPDCAGQDFSAFTITGQAQSRFTRGGAMLASRVEVYRSRADALGDLAVVDRPGTAACEGAALRRTIAKQARGVDVSVLSARRVARPKVGQRAVAFRIVLGLRRQAATVRLYVDLIGFVRDRAAASVLTVSPGRSLPGALRLAAAVDARLQRVA